MFTSSSSLLPSSTSRIPPPPTHPFFFRRRTSTLNWSSLHSLNLDRIIQTVDVSSLQLHLDQLAFSDLTTADLPHLHPTSLLHLFRLMQLIIEYLIHCQSCLYHAHATSHAEAELLAKRCVEGIEEAREKLKKKQREVRDFKRELMVVREQLDLMSNAAKKRGGREERADRQVRVDGHVYACRECDAAFISPAYLTGHMQRRHSTVHSAPLTQEEEKEQLPFPFDDSRARDEQRLRFVEEELERESQRDQQRQAAFHDQLNASQRRQMEAEQEREMRWQRQLKAQQAQLMELIQHQQQQQQQKQEEAQAAQGEKKEEHASGGITTEWLHEWQVEMQQLMESRMNDAFQREESKREVHLLSRLQSIERQLREMKEERREGEDGTLRRVMAELSQLKEDTARLIDVRTPPSHDADIQTEDPTVVDPITAPPTSTTPSPSAPEVVIERSVRPRVRQAVYSVVASMPFLLARYPHSPSTVERMMAEVGVKAGEVEGQGDTGEDAGEEGVEVERKADEFVRRYYPEVGEDGKRQEVAVEAKLSEMEEKRREREEEERRRREDEAVEAELDFRRRTLQQQKEDLAREDEEEEKRGVAHTGPAAHTELRRRQQREAEDKAEEERWRREEEAVLQAEAAKRKVAPALTVTPSLPRVVAQGSPISMATPAFHTVEASPVSAAAMRRGGSPRRLTLDEEEEEGRGDWDWEKEQEEREEKEEEDLEDRADALRIQEVMRGRGAAGSGHRPLSTLAERKKALMQQGFSLMRPPAGIASESAGGEVRGDEESGSPVTPLDHAAVRGRVRPSVGRRHGHLSPFRPLVASKLGSRDV